MSAFQARQAAERKRLGLDAEKAKKAYPTPEVRFGAAASWICPGEATTTVLLEGKLAPGTLVGTANESVEIVKEELTAKGWQGTFKIKPGTRGPVTLEVIAPVSGISSNLELPIGCPREWVIDVKDGDRLVLKVLEGESRAPGEWFRAGKSIDVHAFQLATDGKTTFTLMQEESAEDRERIQKAQEPLTNKAMADRQHKLTNDMQGCTNLPPAQMAPCIQKYSGELQEMMSAQQGAVEKAQQAAGPKAGCLQLQGTISGKKLAGTGMNCVGKDPDASPPFTGAIR